MRHSGNKGVLSKLEQAYRSNDFRSVLRGAIKNGHLQEHLEAIFEIVNDRLLFLAPSNNAADVQLLVDACRKADLIRFYCSRPGYDPSKHAGFEIIAQFLNAMNDEQRADVLSVPGAKTVYESAKNAQQKLASINPSRLVVQFPKAASVKAAVVDRKVLQEYVDPQSVNAQNVVHLMTKHSKTTHLPVFALFNELAQSSRASDRKLLGDAMMQDDAINAFFLIHNRLGKGFGHEDVLRDYESILKAMTDEQLVRAFSTKTFINDYTGHKHLEIAARRIENMPVAVKNNWQRTYDFERNVMPYDGQKHVVGLSYDDVRNELAKKHIFVHDERDHVAAPAAHVA